MRGCTRNTVVAVRNPATLWIRRAVACSAGLRQIPRECVGKRRKTVALRDTVTKPDVFGLDAKRFEQPADPRLADRLARFELGSRKLVEVVETVDQFLAGKTVDLFRHEPIPDVGEQRYPQALVVRTV